MQTMQQELVLDAAEVARRRADGHEAAGTLTLAPGAALAEHTHDGHGHHVWVVGGTAEVLGRELTAGAYWFVPAGRAHALTAIGEEPCELFWVYEPASS